MLLLERGFGAIGNFEEFVVKLIKAGQHQLGGNANPIPAISGTHQAEGESLLIKTDSERHDSYLHPDLCRKIVEMVNQGTDAGNRYLDLGAGFHGARADRGAATDQITR